MLAEDRHRQNSSERGPAQDRRRAPGRAPAASAGQHHRANREAFGNLVQKDGKEDDPAQSVRNQKSGSDGDAVKKWVDDQAEQHRVTLVRMHELVSVRLFAEVEVRCDRVLEEMNEEVAEQD